MPIHAHARQHLAGCFTRALHWQIRECSMPSVRRTVSTSTPERSFAIAARSFYWQPVPGLGTALLSSQHSSKTSSRRPAEWNTADALIVLEEITVFAILKLFSSICLDCNHSVVNVVNLSNT